MSTIPVPEVLEQDPSMAPLPVAVAPVVAPLPVEVAPTPVVVAPVENRYEYQPKDEHGRPMGGKQVIVYTDMADLQTKWAAKEEQLVRKLREVTRKQRLGITDTAMPDDIERFPKTVQFNEKPLTPEERFAIAQDLTDPSKFGEARDRLLESAIGVPPAELRETLNRQQVQTQQIMARQNAEVWLERHPEFYACSENIDMVCDWMTKNGLPPTVKNFEYAQTQMSEAGLLLSSPIVREVQPVVAPVVTPVEIQPQPQAVVSEPTRISEVPTPQLSAAVPTEKRITQSHVPSGLNNRIASRVGALGQSEMDKLTLKDVDKMSSEEYKRQIMTNPAFVKRVNELSAAAPARPRHN